MFFLLRSLTVEFLVFFGNDINGHKINPLHRKGQSQVVVQGHNAFVTLFLRLMTDQEIDNAFVKVFDVLL